MLVFFKIIHEYLGVPPSVTSCIATFFLLIKKKKSTELNTGEGKKKNKHYYTFVYFRKNLTSHQTLHRKIKPGFGTLLSISLHSLHTKVKYFLWVIHKNLMAWYFISYIVSHYFFWVKHKILWLGFSSSVKYCTSYSSQ